MRSKPIISALVGTSFLGLSVTGIYLFFTKSDGEIIFIHVLLGGIFLLVALFHVRNNFLSLKGYLSKRIVKICLGLLIATIIFLSSGFSPFNTLTNAYARFKAQQPSEMADDLTNYNLALNPTMTLEVRAGKHFWFPQLAVWVEDSAGVFKETLFVTNSTAKGHFLGGRTKDNFKSFDSDKGHLTDEYRRVDALPYWSHARGIEEADGLFAPSRLTPLPDGISGATPKGDFKLHVSTPDYPYKLFLEANVAFDDNKYFSKYDFPEDSLYHNGTGLLGQPSVVYAATIDPTSKYSILDYIGHTYPNGTMDTLYQDKKGLTTALDIIDLALLKVE